MSEPLDNPEALKSRLFPFTAIPRRIFEMGIWAQMTRKELATYGVLCFHRNREDALVYLAVETIAAKAGLERRAVQLALGGLIRRGLIELVEAKPWTPRVYRVLHLLRAHAHAREGRVFATESSAQPCAQTRTVEPDSTTQNIPVVVSKAVEYLGLKPGKFESYVESFGMQRVTDLVLMTAKKRRLGIVKSPVAYLEGALAKASDQSNKSPTRPSGYSVYRPDVPGAKDAREKRRLEPVEEDGSWFRKQLAELPSERRDSLRLQVQNDPQYAEWHSIFKEIDPLTDVRENAVRLARAMFRVHIRTNGRMRRSAPVQATPVAPPLLAAVST